MRNPLGWHYPAGAENDPNAPWNQADGPECSECSNEISECEEGKDKCDECELEGEMKDALTEKGCKPQDEKGLAACPLCGEAAIVWIDPKLSTRIPPTDFYSIGCIDVGSCGLEVNGWLNKDDMIKHWNKRAK